ncbi:hypothetical protein DAI67_004063 [Salmonella enterica subsp. enterica serovar Glostrup]|nr:hypothetical protein [Salmonella enterica subsp. enterica serovar Sandiego]EEJ3825226.1 hypothetical protein [Salmonella enterica subsp. enterica serovar Glostrup]EEK2577747.1 hypothetical protein [Salmonella enterica subsp. enterica serovar Montevideo]EEP1513796.1 hypothetical protein [Salmonella enterica]
MNIFLLKVESAKYVQEIDLNNETGEVVVKFSCETPLNEMDTCDMLGFYFGEVYYEVSDEGFFIRKGSVSEMGGNMRLEASEKSIGLKAGDIVTIPIISGIEKEGSVIYLISMVILFISNALFFYEYTRCHPSNLGGWRLFYRIP